ncbi:MAG: tungsten formylmethanofuran dehydrogenase [Cyclobacteriaceae bacterium]|nr:tungsten formylmethanofuran dehydrogenase [Cyclobacteriaceae bacterium]
MIEAKKKAKATLDTTLLKEAYKLMSMAKRMAEKYDEEKEFCSTYVHSTSRGHEAIQLAAGMQLRSTDYASLYYRDESILLGMGMQPNELMMQLMAKKDDPFTGGRSYYGHPALKREGFPTIPHQSSATGMQAIPATGMAQAISYLESQEIAQEGNPIVLCSLGDGCVTEGEVSEAFQMAALHQLPILYLVQDNDWGISATGEEMRSMDAYEFAAGFKGLERMRVDGSNFVESYRGLEKAIAFVRKERKPVLVHAKCALLGHHTSGVRKEWYRSKEDLAKHQLLDPVPILEDILLEEGIARKELSAIQKEVHDFVEAEYESARNSEDPDISDFDSHEFAPTPITEEKGIRIPKEGEKVVMVDAALHAIDDILEKHPEALLYGQDVGGTLGGVFREAATLAQKYGHHRVFNTPIQEAYIVGSTAGMSAVGAKPIVEIQFADYVWPGINQLVEELSKSCYLSKGKFPVQSLIRIPIGAYGGGGPYHSGSVESTLLNIRGIKVIYPSNGADMKGLLKAAFYDPNPVVSLEHKGLYWSKVKGTEAAKAIDPDEEYIIPLGKAAIALYASEHKVESGESVGVVTYGMGVHWALNAEKQHKGKVEILDLRTLNPIDWQAIIDLVKKHNKVLVLTEEPVLNSFAESLAGRIGQECFEYLDAPVRVLGSANLPAVPLNKALEEQMLPNADKVAKEIGRLLQY